MTSPETSEPDALEEQQGGRCEHGTNLDEGDGDCAKCGQAERKVLAGHDTRAKNAYALLAQAMDSAGNAYTEIQELLISGDELMEAAGGEAALTQLALIDCALAEAARILENRNLRAVNSELRARIRELENEQ